MRRRSLLLSSQDVYSLVPTRTHFRARVEHAMKAYKHIAVVLFLAQLCLASASADTVDSIVVAEMKRQYSPGVAIAIVKNGRPAKVAGYGLANIEHQAKVTPATFFQTGSVGKQFVAALVLLLVNDGKLKLDEPVSAYLPNAPPAWHSMTIRQLLTQTSGMDNVDRAIDLRKDYTEDALLESAYKVPPLSLPGERYAYSNLGYQVLGIFCSKVGGRFYGDQLRERLFVPSGMNSRIISERDIVPGRAAGYDRVDGVLFNQQWVSPSLNTTADGSLYVSAQDMARWSIVLDGDTVLTPAMKEAMWAPSTLNSGEHWDYGFGWRLFSVDGRRSVRHRGDWQGFTSHILHFPEDRLTITVLMNRSNAQPHVIADKIAAQYIPALRRSLVAPPSAMAILKTPMYIEGSMNDWKAVNRLESTEPGVFEVTLPLKQAMHEFRILSEDGKTINFGAFIDEVITTLDQPKHLEFAGEDFFIQINTSGRYIFRLDARNARKPILVVRSLTVPTP
jgi:CubicO group peptidase (beta-lactamase class C family)